MAGLDETDQHHGSAAALLTPPDGSSRIRRAHDAFETTRFVSHRHPTPATAP
jgi:hypothetical protein